MQVAPDQWMDHIRTNSHNQAVQQFVLQQKKLHTNSEIKQAKPQVVANKSSSLLYVLDLNALSLILICRKSRQYYCVLCDVDLMNSRNYDEHINGTLATLRPSLFNSFRKKTS
jgi:hypothetical protein